MASRPALWLCAAIALAGCEAGPAVDPGAPPRPAAPVDPAGRDVPPPAATMEPGDEAETLENRRRELDADGDGFVDRAEAESFYRWRFERLDEDGDGRLSRVELRPRRPGHAGVPEAGRAVEAMVGAAEEAYVDAELERFHLRADRTTGMVSTADFDELAGTAAPAVDDPR